MNPERALGRAPSRAGATLAELIITVAVISVIGVSLAGSFVYLTRALQDHRLRTLAITLSQERVEALKAQPYFAVIPTAAPLYDGAFSPPLPYDSALYAPETITTGGAAFKRLVYVDRVIESGGRLVAVPYDSLDTGLKRVSVTTVWSSGGGWRKYTVTNLVANSAQPPSGRFEGTVTDAAGGPIGQAQIFTMQNGFFHGQSDETGAYGFAVTPGSYTVTAVAPGYFRKSAGPFYVSGGVDIASNFSLTAMSSGSFSGAAYVNRHLLVSQVVASTVTAAADLSVRDVEYVELFDPTTFPINVGAGASPSVELSYDGPGHAGDVPDIPLVYVSTYVKPGGYYLVANATSFMLAGQWVTSDAYYASLYTDVIQAGKPGAVLLSDRSGVEDGVGWTATPQSAPWSEGNAVPQSGGLQAGDQLVRLSSAGALSAVYGRAYDSGDNATSFAYRGGTLLAAGGISYAPLTAASLAQPVVSGAPAYGAVVTANDGLSASTAAWKASINGYPYAAFKLVGVATGTWTVEVSSGGAYLAIANATVLAQGAMTGVPNASTTPAWPLSGANAAILSTTTGNGFVAGRVTAPNGASLAAVTINVEPAASGVTDAQGRYAISVPAGTYSVVANPGSDSAPFYGSASLNGVAVAAGQFNGGNDMVLSGAGAVTGYVCDYSDTNPYPGVTVTASDAAGHVLGQAVTGLDGRFEIAELSTGTYTVAPLLDEGQDSGPLSQDLTVTLGAAVAADTFTITGAYGVIAGSVTLSGAPLTSGALIVATTGTIDASLPPSMSSAALADIPYYMTSSKADGTYAVRVKATASTTTFNVYGWYTPNAADAPDPPEKKNVSIVVTGGQTARVGLQWP